MKRIVPLLSVAFLAISLLLARVMYTMPDKQAHLDAGLLTGDPCHPPCWQNLTPGKSTEKEVDEFLDTLSLQVWSDQRVDELIANCKSIQYSDASGPSRVSTKLFRINIKSGILTFVESFPEIRITLDEIVDQFGVPEYYEAILAVGPEDAFYKLEVYYPKQGISFTVSPDQRDKGQVKKNMPVQAIHYYEPGDLLAYLISRYSCDMGQNSAEKFAHERITKFVRPWIGFGPVEMIETK